MQFDFGEANLGAAERTAGDFRDPNLDCINPRLRWQLNHRLALRIWIDRVNLRLLFLVQPDFNFGGARVCFLFKATRARMRKQELRGSWETQTPSKSMVSSPAL